MNYSSPELQNALAAEFVLGTLRGPARRHFVRLLGEDAVLAEIVVRWEEFLTPLADQVAPVEPPARVWRLIEQRIAARQPAGQTRMASERWWQSLLFWRNWGLAASGLAAALLIALIVVRPEVAQEPAMVSVLSSPENVPRMIVEQQRGALLVTVVKPWPTMTTQDLELWVIPSEGAPRSLGVVHYANNSVVKRIDLDAMLAGGVVFAISKEPKGGSTTGAPTGPVLCSGAIARIKT